MTRALVNIAIGRTRGSGLHPKGDDGAVLCSLHPGFNRSLKGIMVRNVVVRGAKEE